MDSGLAPVTVRISELRKNPAAVITAAGGRPAAVLNRNRPVAYLVPAKAWDALVERLEDSDLAGIVRERAGEIPVAVSPGDL